MPRRTLPTISRRKCTKYGLKLKLIALTTLCYLYKPRKMHLVKVGRKKLIFLFVTLVFFSAILLSNRIIRMKRQRELFTGAVLETPSCKLPYLPIQNPEIMKHITNVDRIVCDTTADWVIANATHAYVTEEAKAKLDGPIVCKFFEIIRVNEDVTKISEKITQGQWYKFDSVDFVEVACAARRERWTSYLAVPRSNVPLPKKQKTRKRAEHPPVNVLMWGHDSLSRNMFIRKLPASYEYLTKELNGYTLQGYNIVGDGTPQALIPILTGKTELELPETRKRKGTKANFVDVYPFIWKDFSNQGYLTAYIEDCNKIGTFTYRLKGFKDSPTDFYMRPYFTAAETHYHTYPKFCIGSIPRHKKIIDYIKYILSFRREIPKFIFGFYNELSHDSTNTIQGADFDIKEFFSDMHQTGILNETILVAFSDHGHRFAALRELQQGKQEERMPFFMFVFPPWFQKVYPLAFNNFLKNTKRLSTPFDIHATLQDILNLERLTDNQLSVPNSIFSREMSLFREIPLNRTCANAHIEPHWCACLQWRVINPNSSIAQRAALEFVNYINEVTDSNREICAELEVGKVLWAANFHPTEELLRFRQTVDLDGREPDLSDHTTVDTTIIQLKLETTPGYAHFEVSLTYNIADYQFNIRESDISRINKYASQAGCVEADETLLHLRKYCYCKKM